MAKAYWIAHVTVTTLTSTSTMPVTRRWPSRNTALFSWPRRRLRTDGNARGAPAMWWLNSHPCKPPAIATIQPNTRRREPSVSVPWRSRYRDRRRRLDFSFSIFFHHARARRGHLLFGEAEKMTGSSPVMMKGEEES